MRRVSMPDPDALCEDLRFLRDAADPRDPRHDRRWRRVDAWLAHAFAGDDAASRDARQETLIAILRHIGAMTADAPLQCVKWVSTIHRHKRIDAMRAQKRDPIRRGLDEPVFDDGTTALDRIAAPDGRTLSADALERLVETALAYVHEALELAVANPMKRQLRKTQAHAAVLRLVCGLDADAIEDALAIGEPIGKDRLYKWVERGRAPLADGLRRWAERDPEMGDVCAVLLELTEERRADAGVPRAARASASPVAASRSKSVSPVPRAPSEGHGGHGRRSGRGEREMAGEGPGGGESAGSRDRVESRDRGARRRPVGGDDRAEPEELGEGEHRGGDG